MRGTDEISPYNLDIKSILLNCEASIDDKYGLALGMIHFYTLFFSNDRGTS